MIDIDSENFDKNQSYFEGFVKCLRDICELASWGEL